MMHVHKPGGEKPAVQKVNSLPWHFEPDRDFSNKE